MDAPRSRSLLVVARWISLLSCGVVAAAVMLLIEIPVVRLCAPLADSAGKLPAPAMLGIVTALVAACCWAVAKGRWRGFVGLRFLPGYPPLWVAVVFGLLIWIVGESWIGGLVTTDEHWADLRRFASEIPSLAWAGVVATLAVVLLAPLVGDVRSVMRRWRATATVLSDKSPNVFRDFSSVRQWLQDDSEIDSPESDLFNHNAISLRMAERLVDPTEAPTMAVIGPLGSGKSTVRRLVQHRLRDDRRICIVALSLWPFDSAEAAVRGILRALVRGLSRQVNVLPLVGLSDDYVTAIEKTAGMYGGIARLLRGASDPEAIVRRFSDIGRAAGVRLVLWVEDLERFSGGDQLEGPPRAEREVERLGPIRALLHLLDRSPQVSVIVSDVSLRTRFDLGKIARFVEQMPPMGDADAWRVVELLRSECLGGHPIAVIDPASSDARGALKLESASHSALSWLSAFRQSNLSVPVAALRVLWTPRALKSALRLALETWEALPGEVDFDAVLVASVLRTTRPDVFATVAEHIDLFQHGMTDPLSVRGEKGRPHPVVSRIDEMLAPEEGSTGAAIKTLLSYLFPRYPPGGDSGDREYIDQPQALSVDRHTDYWRRYLSQSRVPDSESDQRALQCIQAWQAQRPSDLVDRLIDLRRCDQIETFVGQFKAIDLCRLLIEVADRLSGVSASQWEHRSHAPGVTSVWRMMHRCTPREEQVFHAVKEIVRRIGPVHLPLAYDITYYFAAHSAEVPRLMSDAQRLEVRRLLQETLSESFSGDGAELKLALAVRDGSPWIIAWIAWGIERIRGNDRHGLPFDRWPPFANVLLNLAERQPQVGIPLVIPFVTRGGMKHTDSINERGKWEPSIQWTGEFEVDTAKRLFPFDRLVRVLAQYQIPDDLDTQTKAYFEAAIKGAREMNATS